MSPYCLQYRTRKCISSCEGRHHLNKVLVFLGKDMLLILRTVSLIHCLGIYGYVFFII